MLDSQPGSSSFPEGTSSPDGLHAANYKGNPGSVKVGAKTSLIAVMLGSHQMSGLFIRLGSLARVVGWLALTFLGSHGSSSTPAEEGLF